MKGSKIVYLKIKFFGMKYGLIVENKQTYKLPQLVLTSTDVLFSAQKTLIRVLCRTQLQLFRDLCSPIGVTSTPQCLGYWANSCHLFFEAEILFKLQNIQQKFIVTNSSNNLIQGIVRLDAKGTCLIWNALLRRFVVSKSVSGIFDLKTFPIDRISPTIENPFSYYKVFMLDIISQHSKNTPQHFLVIFYPSIHYTATKELCVWHLTRHGFHHLIPFVHILDFTAITCIGWYACQGNDKDDVIVNFGFRLVDYIQITYQKIYIEGELILRNPFNYIEFYIHDTNIKCVRIFNQIDPECIVYKGSHISISTECQTISKKWNLETFNCMLTLKQLMFFVWDLYCKTLSNTEYEAVLCDRGIILNKENSDQIQEDYPRGEVAYHHFIWNHHNITKLVKLKNHEFVCQTHEM